MFCTYPVLIEMKFDQDQTHFHECPGLPQRSARLISVFTENTTARDEFNTVYSILQMHVYTKYFLKPIIEGLSFSYLDKKVS